MLTHACVRLVLLSGEGEAGSAFARDPVRGADTEAGEVAAGARAVVTHAPVHCRDSGAARGGVEQKQFPWGDDPPEMLENYAMRWKTGPEPVGRGEKNAFGLFDIGANVHEWCSDWFQANYYSISNERNPKGSESGSRRASLALRGVG